MKKTLLDFCDCQGPDRYGKEHSEKYIGLRANVKQRKKIIEEWRRAKII